MIPEFRVQHDDVLKVGSDLLLVKYAHGFYGADMQIARALARAAVCSLEEIDPAPDSSVIVETAGAIAPSRVMFLGTPALSAFSYNEMRHFAARSIEILASRSLSVGRMTTVIHGVGYGLDAVESIHSLIQGFREALATHELPTLEQIVFVERDERRARILASSLGEDQPEPVRPRTEPQSEAPDEWLQDASLGWPSAGTTMQPPPGAEDRPASAKRHVFVAMPYAEEFEDVYEFGIYGPVRRCGYICERVDQAAFTGDILQRIRERIETADLVIAELSGARPNVYLEVGYAWGKGIPVIFVAREGEEPHFDVKPHRCLSYRTIRQLARDLERLLQGLRGSGNGAG